MPCAILSAWTNDWAEIPTDEALFEKYLVELCKNETGVKENNTTQGEKIEVLRERWKVRW